MSDANLFDQIFQKKAQGEIQLGRLVITGIYYPVVWVRFSDSEHR